MENYFIFKIDSLIIFRIYKIQVVLVFVIHYLKIFIIFLWANLICSIKIRYPSLKQPLYWKNIIQYFNYSITFFNRLYFNIIFFIIWYITLDYSLNTIYIIISMEIMIALLQHFILIFYVVLFEKIIKIINNTT